MTVAGVVYVVAKAPRPGTCKTRLCPPLSPNQAADLARAFLLDTLGIVRQAGLIPRIICSGADEHELLQAMVGRSVRVSSQTGDGLGDALEAAFCEGVADGFGQVAVLGADSPTLPADILREAFCVLDADHTIAVGPSRDGGYYLLAATTVHPSLFRDMTWSTSEVAAETLRRCRAAGLQSHVLPTWYDVDDADSLADLDAELLVLPGSIAARTRAVRQAALSRVPARLAPVGAGW